MPMLDWLTKELEQIKQKGLFRRLRRIDEASDATTVLEGRSIHLFSSNNYLGLANHPRLKEKATEAIMRYGTGSGGSRLTTGNLALHEDLERKIASFKGKEDAIVFSSGYLANVGILSSLMGKGDFIFSDALNHASIIDGCRLSRADTIIYRHVDMEDLERKLASSLSSQSQSQSQPSSSSRRLIVTDGVFSMDGNIAPLPEMVRLAEKYGAMLMVDDAHATGVLGEKGAGTAEYYGLSDKVDIAMGTLSKAIGAEGGYAAASRSVVEFLRNRARSFIFQTSLSPGVVAAALEGITMLQEEPQRRKRLLENASYLRQGLANLGFRLVDGSTPIIAVIIGDASDAVQFSRRLEEEGVFAPAIRPPTVPEGMSRIRVTVMATHQREDLDYALESFAKVGKELGVIK